MLRRSYRKPLNHVDPQLCGHMTTAPIAAHAAEILGQLVRLPHTAAVWLPRRTRYKRDVAKNRSKVPQSQLQLGQLH
jgi:hypothetical protein